MSENSLKTLLEELESAAKKLQESLLARDADRIFQDLDRQEQSLENLNDLCSVQGGGLEDTVRKNPSLRQMLQQCHSIVQANRSLARRFLDVIDQTFSRLSGGSSVAYAGGYGNTMQRSTPILVRQQG
jgi:DNA repair exonuclease SbcCD ATPase subunit